MHNKVCVYVCVEVGGGMFVTQYSWIKPGG